MPLTSMPHKVPGSSMAGQVDDARLGGDEGTLGRWGPGRRRCDVDDLPPAGRMMRAAAADLVQAQSNRGQCDPIGGELVDGDAVRVIPPALLTTMSATTLCDQLPRAPRSRQVTSSRRAR